ncbi:SpoIIE family protein phosphatase [Peptostreptococcaceae bacterium AGR-M142]
MSKYCRSDKFKIILEIIDLVTKSKNFFLVKDKILDKMLSIVHPNKACINIISKNNRNTSYLICTKTLGKIFESTVKKIPDISKYQKDIYKIEFSKYPEYIHDAINEKKIVFIEDVYTDERAKKDRFMAKCLGYKGSLIVPFMINNDVLGFITCYLDDGDTLDKEDIDFINTISFIIGFSLEITNNNNHTNKIIDRLRSSVSYINEATIELYKNKGIDSFLDLVSSQLCKITNSESAIVLLKDEKLKTQRFSQYGKEMDMLNVFEFVLESIKINLDDEGNYYNYKETKAFIEDNNIENDEFIESFIYYKLKKNDQVIGYIMAANGKKYINEDLTILNIFANQIVIALQMYINSQDILEHKLMQKELEIASKQQKLIMSDNKIYLENLGEISFYHRPSKHIGGDFCKIMKLSPTKVAIFLTDVMGHGILSNYFSAMIKGVLKTLLIQGNSCSAVLTQMNKVLFSDFDNVNIFATSRIAIVDTIKNKIISANAGHHFPIGIKKINNDYIIEELDVEEGMPIGIFETTEYEEHEYELDEYEIVAFYTDGIIEAENEFAEQYGIERLKMFLLESFHLSSDIIYEKFKREIVDFTGRENLEDDFILMLLKKNGNYEIGVNDVYDYEFKSQER